MARTLFARRLLAPVFATLFAIPLTGHSQRAEKRAAPKQAVAQAATPLYTPPKPPLPQVFAGWQVGGTPQISDNPQVADNAHAAILKEYGFSRYEAANYTRSADTLAVKAVQFEDATGAYGAFTFFRHPNMSPENIGQGAAFDGNRVLFWNGTFFVEATFSRITATSAGELRDLCTLLPRPVGNQGTLPTLPDYLPPQHLRAETVQYAIGPEAYSASGGVLPASLVDFGLSAEAVTAQYDSLNGTGTLTILNYPTPEIAAARQRAIQSFFTSHENAKNGPQDTRTTALANSYPEALRTRRSGPLVAITSGEFSAGSAQELLQHVHYEAILTLGNSGRYVPDTTKLAQLIISVAYLVGIFALIAIVAAISLGGGRVLLRKLRRNTGHAEDESSEFIRLNLKT